MAQLVAKLVGWFAEHIIVAGLSRSKRFQSLALWIDHHITHKKKIVEDHTMKVTEKADEFAKTFKKALEEETKAAVEASKVQTQAKVQANAPSAASATVKTKATPTPPPSSSSTSTSSSNAGSYSSSGGRYTNSPSNRVDRIR